MRRTCNIRGIQNGPHMGRTFAEVIADRRSIDWQRELLVAQKEMQTEMIHCTMRVTPEELPRYIEQYERQQANKTPAG